MTREEERAGTLHRSGQGSLLLGDLGGSVAVSWRKVDRFRNVRVLSDLVTAVRKFEDIVRGNFYFDNLAGNFESPALFVEISV